MDEENNFQDKSVVCKTFQWSINTQINKEIYNQTPYQFSFGQIPQFGIENLPLSPDLLDKIATEKYLNCTFNLPEGQRIEDAHIELDSGQFTHEEVLPLDKVMCPENNLHQYPKQI